MEEISNKVISVEQYMVGSVPSVLYIPEYVSAAEQDQLLQNVITANYSLLLLLLFPHFHLIYYRSQINEAPISKWKSLKNRRLQNWGTHSLSTICISTSL